MAYERVNWENLPSTKTPVNADNLNKMDAGIKDLETETDTKLNKKQEKLTAGTGIEITGTNIINNLNANYSTNEQKIGTWIDGKPLYRKIYQFNMPQCATSGTPVLETHTIENASYSFIEFGHIYANFINAPVPYITRQNPSWAIGTDLDSPNTLRIWNSFKDWNSAKILVSVLYTK